MHFKANYYVHIFLFECRSVLVFRLGGISAEVSVVNVHNGMYKISTSVTDSTLGGDLFTDELVKFLALEYKR